jgi:Carbohydrate-selective porin, OprB family/S-layer homology domain
MVDPRGVNVKRADQIKQVDQVGQVGSRKVRSQSVRSQQVRSRRVICDRWMGWFLGSLCWWGSMQAVGAMPLADRVPERERGIPDLRHPNSLALFPEIDVGASGLEFAQATSVAELSDVAPTDWAYQAVKTLIDRYGLITGYPDGTFRGDRALTRYEFASILAVVLENIQRFNDREEDLRTIRRLQAIYQDALNELKLRTDRFDRLLLDLERQQFSTTTKFSGRTDFVLTNGTNAKATLISRTRLNFNTSFSGPDLLVTQLEAGNDGQDAIAANQVRQGNRLSTFGLLADGGGLDVAGVPSQVRLRKLYYRFNPSKNLAVAVGTAIPPSDFIDRNSFANTSGQNFASSFFGNNPLIVQNEIDRFGGAGFAVDWQLRQNLSLRGLLSAVDAASPQDGLFGDRYQASLEAEYQFQLPITLRLQYTNARINGTSINAFGLNGEWAITRQASMFVRLGFGSYNGFNTILNQDLELSPKSWALGGTLRNFIIPGSKAGLAFGQPFISPDLGNRTQTNVEAYFGILLNDSINFSPSLLYIANPDNQKGASVWQWAVRMTFTF